MIQEKINTDIKEAMMSKDSVRLNVLRGIKTAITNDLVSRGKTPQDSVTDEEAIVVITKLAKQRKDSIEQFKNGGREDLVANEEAELAFLTPFLPQLMSQDEIKIIALSKQTELGITDKAKSGMLMASVMKELKGKADGSDVKIVVDSLFA